MEARGLSTHQFAEFLEAAGRSLDAERRLGVQQIHAIRPRVRPLLFNFGDDGAYACARICAGFC